MTTREKCSICGREVEYRWMDTSTGDEPNARELMAWRCPSSSCPNHDPGAHDYEWAIPL